MDSMDAFGVILGVALIVYGLIRLLKRYNLKKRCTAQVTGTVMNTNSGRKTDAAGEGINHYVKLAYSAEGVEYEKEFWITKRQYYAMSAGQSITVFYDHSNPKRCYVAEIKPRIFLTSCFIAVGCILIVVFL